MKKKRNGMSILKVDSGEILLKMKLLTLLIFAAFVSASASSYSQSVKFNLNMKEVSIRDVFQKIEEQSEFIILFNEKSLNVDRKVNVTVKDGTVDQILDQIFEGKKDAYQIFDRQILISKINEISKIPLSNGQNMEVQQLQTKRLTGTVFDNEGLPVPGATVVIKGTAKGTVTGVDGTFTINVEPNSAILVSFIGFESQEIVVGNKTTLKVVLKATVAQIDDVTIVAFGTQKKESVVAAITTIKPGNLKVPSSNLTTALAGRAAGIISYQRSGDPGSDDASFFIRGITTFGANTKPLILIDNIELATTDLSQLQPDDIESFSIMKDASATALYGARGANGVILVKTKKGQKGKLKTTFRIENSISAPTRDLKLADPITYMKLNNEAITTREPLGEHLYTEDKIYNTVPGSGSYIYPSTDWKSELLKDYTMNQRINLSISGGGDLVTYYVAGSYTHDNGILKVDKRNNFNSNIKSNVYTFRSNITLNLTNTTQISSNFNGSFKDYQGPIYSGSDMYSLIMRSNPTLFPAYYPVDDAHLYTNHIMFGNVQSGSSYYINPYAEMVKGYKENGRSNLSAQFELTQKFDFITKGLSARALFNILRISSHSISRFYNPYWYSLGSYDKKDNTYSIVNVNPDGGTDYLGYNSEVANPTANTYFEAAVNYNREFGKHTLSGLLVYQLHNNVNLGAGDIQSSLPYRNVGLSGRATYAYDSRYIAEVNFGYNGSERFYKTHQFGFFPSAGVAWNISKEPWFSKYSNTITNLKLRVSYGLVGNDEISSNRFLYLSNINMNNTDLTQYFGLQRAYSNNGISVSRYADKDITWEKAKKTNFALELGLKNGFTMTAEYYTENRSQILLTRSNIPSTMGLWVIPESNVGSAKAHGIDVTLNYDKYFGNSMWIQMMGNFTFARSKYSEYDELTYDKEWWLSKVGYSVNQSWGYIAERLFVDEKEVANSPTQFGTYLAGDIKYRDVNGDGEITTLDKVPIGYPTSPEIIYGFGASFGYKQFDVSLFFQGLANESFFINYGQTSPFFSNNEGALVGSNQLTSFIADSHWSEENRDIYAVWPRLSTSSVSNNAQTNTWFLRDGSFLRLKSAEFGYSLPKQLVKKINVQNFRVYLSGTNLLCWSKFKLWDVEQGTSALNYPLQRVFNVGVNVTF